MGGIVLAAAYMLWMLQRVVLGQPQNPTISQLTDLSMRELATVVPLAVLILWIGLYPSPLMEMMDASVMHLVQHMAEYQSHLPDLVAIR
jgi:NADH-quinone oxidoreductase subunit M